jgi:flagellar biogenesis protein FliO
MVSPSDREGDNSQRPRWSSFSNEAPPDTGEAGFIHFLLILLVILAIIALTIWIVQQLA